MGGKKFEFRVPFLKALLFPLALSLCCCAGTALRDGRTLSARREQIGQIQRDLENIAQVLIYAGRVGEGDLARRALDIAMEIVGQPEDWEMERARHLTERDLADYGRRVHSLLKERRRALLVADRACRRLVEDLPRLHAARKTLRTATVGLVLGLGLLFLLRR
jgi:hypothetical protein